MYPSLVTQYYVIGVEIWIVSFCDPIPLCSISTSIICVPLCPSSILLYLFLPQLHHNPSMSFFASTLPQSCSIPLCLNSTIILPCSSTILQCCSLPQLNYDPALSLSAPIHPGSFLVQLYPNPTTILLYPSLPQHYHNPSMAVLAPMQPQSCCIPLCSSLASVLSLPAQHYLVVKDCWKLSF